MAHRPIQLDLFAEGHGIPREIDVSRAPSSETICADRLVQFLLARIGQNETYVHAMFSHAELPTARRQETSNILLHHLFGLAGDETQVFGNACRPFLQRIWNALVFTLYAQAFPGLLRSNDHADLHGRTLLPGGTISIRTAYDIRPLQGWRNWKQAAAACLATGQRPILLCLTESPETARMPPSGWLCLEGEAAITRIRHDTKTDPEAVLYLAGQDRSIKDLCQREADRMRRRFAAMCLRQFQAEKSPFRTRILSLIAQDDAAMREIFLQSRNKTHLATMLGAMQQAEMIAGQDDPTQAP